MSHYSLLNDMSLDDKISILEYLAFGYDKSKDMNKVLIAIADEILKERLSNPYFLPEQLDIRKDIGPFPVTFENPERVKLQNQSDMKNIFDIFRYLAFGFDYYGNMDSSSISCAKIILGQRSTRKDPCYLPQNLKSKMSSEIYF